MGKASNTFVTMLDLLGVKHTKMFSNQYFNEHPHKYNLYGLSKMLSDYGIRNVATRIVDKENDLFNIKLPFVAHAGSSFLVVYKVDSDKVHYLWSGKKIVISVLEFIKFWSGIILLAETSPESGEPDYATHRKKDWLTLAQKSIIALAGILILGLAYIYNVFPSLLGEFNSPLRDTGTVLGITSLLIVNLFGIYICYLLVLKQMRIHSRYADKICTLFSKSDCNNVLESDAAKLWGVFGWSEIGLGYFAANIVILLFLPHLIFYLVIINFLTLPYTVWSVWYQKTKARQWCPLCLIVLVLLWLIFIINLIFGYINIPDFSFHYSLFVIHCSLISCIYAIPIFTLNLLLPKQSEGNQVEQLRQEINSIKANHEVFKSLLIQQPYYEVSKADSQILFGNPAARFMITILTNPFCNPCAKMHARVEKLLDETKTGETGRGESNLPNNKTNICIQYIFSAFNESLEYANRYFTAIYLEKCKESAWRLYSDWFEKGKALQESFFNDLHLNMSNPAIEDEFQKHESWKANTQLRATPTILVNGYKLPDNYKIEDMLYFTEFDVNIK